MLRSCRYCGRIHDIKFDCGKKPIRIRKRRGDYDSEISAFRRKQSWKDMSLSIRERDNFLCQLCIRKRYALSYGTSLTYDNISVHHIDPLAEAPDAGLDRTNLISLCAYHHELAECGKVPREELKAIAREQENSPGVPPAVEFAKRTKSSERQLL